MKEEGRGEEREENRENKLRATLFGQCDRNILSYLLTSRVDVKIISGFALASIFKKPHI